MTQSCVICLENFECDAGLACHMGHFSCHEDLTKYMRENVLPQIFRLRNSNCAVSCPVNGCSSTYNSLLLYHALPSHERTRYRNVIVEFVDITSRISMLRSAMLDLLTLKCPTCKTTVDPSPDACSAILCLNCGHHYCNCCFQSFASGDAARDRGAAHEHASTHNSGDEANLGPFLSESTVRTGQLKHIVGLLRQFLSLAMKSHEFGSNKSQDLQLCTILCFDQLEELTIDPVALWRAAESECSMPTVSSIASNASREPAAQLADAIVTNNLEAVYQVMSTHRDLNANFLDSRGFPLASLAVLWGLPEVAIRLLNTGADPLLQNGQGRSVFYVVLETGDKRLVDALLRNNPLVPLNDPISTEAQNYCSLHVVARYDRGHLVRLLIERGANPDLQEAEWGYTPLIMALTLGHEWTASELIKLGADLSIPSNKRRTALYVAIEKGMIATVRLMLQRGADASAVGDRTSGMSPIHLAVLNGQPLLLELLLRHGAAVNVLDSQYGYTPAMMALFSKYPAAATRLIEAGAHGAVLSTSGRTLMYLAVEHGSCETIAALIAAGINVNHPACENPSFSPPLLLSVIYRQHQVLQQLLRAGANVDVVDREFGFTSLMSAVCNQDEWSAFLLLQAGANVMLQSKVGKNAIIYAVEKCGSSICQMVLEKSPLPLNDILVDGRPLTHFAARMNNPAALRVLCDLGMDLLRRDCNGQTCVDIAKDANADSALALLVALVQ